tara:strand:+ start:109 stop:306 length:198 start_codon:yes stop_codon:yes gene_type:complete
MPLFKKKDKEDKEDKGTDRKESRRDFRLAKIQEVTAKAYAVASKRKWLFLMIAAVITGYLVFKFV